MLRKLTTPLAIKTNEHDIVNLTILINLVNFFVPAESKVKMKANEKILKFVDLARQLKKLWNMKVTVIPIVAEVYGNSLQRPWMETRVAADKWKKKEYPD